MHLVEQGKVHLLFVSQWAPVWGVGDLWQMSLSDFVEKKSSFTNSLYSGRVNELITKLVGTLKEKAEVKFITSCRVMDAKKTGSVWTIKGTSEVLTAEKLLVAQNPWEAMQWLSKDYWPTRLVQVAAKANQ